MKLKSYSILFAQLALFWLFILLGLGVFELLLNGFIHEFPKNSIASLGWMWWHDLSFWLQSLFPAYVLCFLLYLVSAKVATQVLKALILLFSIGQLLLISYFNTALNPLGADLYSYSFDDIKQTVGASGGLSAVMVIAFLVFIGAIVYYLWVSPKRQKPTLWLSFVLPILSLFILGLGFPDLKRTSNGESDFVNDLVINKSAYFYGSSYNYLFPEVMESDIYADSYINVDNDQAQALAFDYPDELNYPFLHRDETPDVLSPFFNKAASPPNIVVILVEGLGRAFTNEGAYLGNFTPFLDSLAGKSLYWTNFMSQGGRTFAVLPSLLGSLPFAKNGFLALNNQMPKQLSLLNLLKTNGYHTAFYYGGDSKFDNMATYLQQNEIDELHDEATFPSGYTKLPVNNGFSWGYNDKEVFRYFLNSRTAPSAGKPHFSVILTVASHNPFLINEPEKYDKLFQTQLQHLDFEEDKRAAYQKYKMQYASIMYADDALKGFFSNYEKRADFKNTIFIITGDHRMPEIPMRSKIDRYHVPLLIYSPLLKRTAEFASVSTHFDIAPSLLGFLKHQYQVKTPTLAAWVGQGLDTARTFRNLHQLPFIQTKTDAIDFIMDDYHLNGNQLFKLMPDLSEQAVQDDEKKNQLKNAFDKYKKRNQAILEGKALLPDSILRQYLPKK